MPYTVKCPVCGKEWNVPDDALDQQCNCHLYCEDGDEPSDCSMTPLQYGDQSGWPYGAHVDGCEASVKTVTFTGLSGDGHWRKSDLNYTVAHDAAVADGIHDDHISVGQVNDYKVSRGAVFFNISELKYCTAIAATLKLYLAADLTQTDVDIVIRRGGGAIPHLPMDVNDYYCGYFSGDGGRRNTSTLPAMWNWWSLPLNSAGLQWITGLNSMSLILMTSNDIKSVPPTANMEEAMFAGYELLGAEFAPHLEVSYVRSPRPEYTYYCSTHGKFTDKRPVLIDVELPCGRAPKKYRMSEGEY